MQEKLKLYKKTVNKHFFHMSVNSKKKISPHIRKRKAISDIIVTLLLMSITLIGGILVWTVFSGNPAITDINTSIPTSQISPPIKLSGYDTRDGNDLAGISTLDNNKNNKLEAGTDFIVLDITNSGIDNFFVVDDVIINTVSHIWDGQTSGSFNPSSLNEGQFSIITTDTSSPTYLSNIINEGTTSRIVIKLGSDLPEDIKLNRSIRVSIEIIGFDLANFIIRSGETI